MSLFVKFKHWFEVSIAGLRIRYSPSYQKVDIEPQGIYGSIDIPWDQATTRTDMEAFAIQKGYDFYRQRLAEYQIRAKEIGFTLRDNPLPEPQRGRVHIA